MGWGVGGERNRRDSAVIGGANVGAAPQSWSGSVIGGGERNRRGGAAELELAPGEYVARVRCCLRRRRPPAGRRRADPKAGAAAAVAWLEFVTSAGR